LGFDAAAQYSGTIKNGDSVCTDVTIYRASVNVGTVVTHDWNVEAIDLHVFRSPRIRSAA